MITASIRAIVPARSLVAPDEPDEPAVGRR
jgi:hypothetical protein